MATTLSYWTIASIVIGLLALFPSIMGFFGKNKFDVKGKVR
jgi:3-dehydrosphinganine reductase